MIPISQLPSSSISKVSIGAPGGGGLNIGKLPEMSLFCQDSIFTRNLTKSINP